jgi:hypothetical protein
LTAGRLNANSAWVVFFIWSLRAQHHGGYLLQQQRSHPRRRRKKKTSAKRKPSRWCTKAPADQIPPIHPHCLYRSGRLCRIFDVDRSTLVRWRKQGKLPKFTRVGGVEGLTGEQILTLYAQGREASEE